jgi:hypothetical protein
MEEKNLYLELKATSPAGVFTGLLSTYGNTDLGGDVVARGAFTKTLAETRGRLPLLLAHDGSKQLGLVKLTDSEVGLQAEGVLNMESALARETHGNLLFNLKHGIASGLSIGYVTVKSTPQKNGTRLLQEVRLKEASYTLTPMNELALISSAKARGADELSTMARLFGEKVDAIVGRRPRLSSAYQALVDDFSRRLDAVVRG